MILVAGGSGRLGTRVVQRLAGRGLSVRVLTRDRARAAHLAGPRVEIVEGDVRDAASVATAVDGADTALSAIHGFSGPGHVTPASVDRDGNINLIDAAEAAGVEHFVLVSIQQAAAGHPAGPLRGARGAHPVPHRGTRYGRVVRGL